MSHTNNKPVSEARLKQILESYGASPSSWPTEERQAALNLLSGSAELRQLYDQAKSLDTELVRLQTLENRHWNSSTEQSLRQNILERLGEQENSQNHGRQHSLRRTAPLWAGSIAAAAFIAVVTFNVVQYSATPHPGEKTQADPGADVFSQWAWEDVTGETLVEDSENDINTLMALVELDYQ